MIFQKYFEKCEQEGDAIEKWKVTNRLARRFASGSISRSTPLTTSIHYISQKVYKYMEDYLIVE